MFTDLPTVDLSQIDSAPLLTARDLARRVAGRLLWQQLSFELFAGERLIVVGPSGTGKSLLLRALAGLDPLENGEVTLLGQPQAAWKLPFYRAAAMLLMQRPVLPGGSVGEMLRRPFSFQVHQKAVWNQAHALELLGHLGRGPEFIEAGAQHLSGGEGQLVALVRALLLDPKVLLLDEATSALDPETTRRFEELVIHWSAQGERAVIAVSHDPAQRQRLGTRELAITGLLL